jgi:hypothetical protein
MKQKRQFIYCFFNDIEFGMAGFSPTEPTILRIPTDLAEVLKLF